MSVRVMAGSRRPPPPKRIDPEEIKAWQRIGRDFTLVVVGAFMLVYETAFVVVPNVVIVGAGLLALGLPPALRLDEIVRRGDDGRGSENDG
jgi:hypothetical protein